MAYTVPVSPEDAERLTKILSEELFLFTPEGGFASLTSPIFWKRVFIRYYQEEPASLTDPRWDELFSIGFPIRRKLTGE